MSVYITDVQFLAGQAVCHVVADSDAEGRAFALALELPTVKYEQPDAPLAGSHYFVPAEMCALCLAAGATLVDPITLDAIIQLRSRRRAQI